MKNVTRFLMDQNHGFDRSWSSKRQMILITMSIVPSVPADSRVLDHNDARLFPCGVDGHRENRSMEEHPLVQVERSEGDRIREIPRQRSPWLGWSLGKVPECVQCGFGTGRERCSFESLPGWRHLSHVHQSFSSADPPREIILNSPIPAPTSLSCFLGDLPTLIQEIQPRTRIELLKSTPQRLLGDGAASRATMEQQPGKEQEEFPPSFLPPQIFHVDLL